MSFVKHMSKYRSDGCDVMFCHVFLQLGEPAAGGAQTRNGRKKAKIALEKCEKVTCRVSKKLMNDDGYVFQTMQSCTCLYIAQLCAWGGCTMPQGYVKHMTKYHADGKSLH